ncbi:hypothetical protein [Streptomyces buecherae]|uniref:hypothetical protein n=1 Tax=Streptomyces buecherae TaxID=2763006 RepID=UPI00378DAE66
MTTHKAVGIMSKLPTLHVAVEWTPGQATAVVSVVSDQAGEVAREEIQRARPLDSAPSPFLLDQMVMGALRWNWHRMTVGSEADTEPGMVFEEAAKEAIEWKGNSHHK